MPRARRAAACPTCSGSGWKVVETGGESHAERCSCWVASERARRLERAGIPEGLRHCDLDSFETAHHPQLDAARRVAQSFVDTYPMVRGTGILFHGAVGGGKTHLAVAIVAELALRKSASALFMDFRRLLKTIQESWNPVSETSEKEVLRRILEVDLLALDDLGAEKPSPWVRETVAYVINERYTHQLPVIITTNLKYAPPPAESEGPRREIARRVGRDAERQDEYLVDRLGVATLSRLYEMCKPVEMVDIEDYRKKVKVFGADKFDLG